MLLMAIKLPITRSISMGLGLFESYLRPLRNLQHDVALLRPSIPKNRQFYNIKLFCTHISYLIKKTAYVMLCYNKPNVPVQWIQEKQSNNFKEIVYIMHETISQNGIQPSTDGSHKEWFWLVIKTSVLVHHF